MRTWSNGPLLVRSDTNRLLKGQDVFPDAARGSFVAWDTQSKCVVRYDPALGRYDRPTEHLALQGEYAVETTLGTVNCRPVFDVYVSLCRHYSPETIARTCWISPEQLTEAARTIWESRPVSYYAWSGHEHHANTTETARAIAMLYALTGSFDAPGGNVLLPSVPTAPITGRTSLRLGGLRRPSARPNVRLDLHAGTACRPRTSIGPFSKAIRTRCGR